MLTSLRRGLAALIALACLGAAPAAFAACTPTTTPNTSGVTANSQLELLMEMCLRVTTPTLPSGAATESTLSALSAKLPSSLGAKAGSLSLSIVPATDAGLALDATVSTLSGKLPATLGAKASSLSLSITPATDATFTLGASEAHIGEVGGRQVTLSNTQTVTASSAYASGNAVGGLMTIANAARVAGGSGLIQSTTIPVKSTQSAQIDVFYFSANPSGSTCTDKTAFSLASADFDKVLGVAHVTDWTGGGTPSFGQAQNLAMPFALASGTTLYACAVVRGTPTFSSTSDVAIFHRVIQN